MNLPPRYRTLVGFIKKELVQALRDPRMKFILFVTPVVQMTLFGVALNNEVKNIRLAAFFDSKDTVLRAIFMSAASREAGSFRRRCPKRRPLHAH